MKKILLLALFCLLFATQGIAADEPKEVVRSIFTTEIRNREPVDDLTEYYHVSDGTIYFFTELKNMQDTQIVHIWHKNGEEVYKFLSSIRGPRWRTNSSMKAVHFKPGDEITVEVMGGDNNVYESKTLKVRE